MTAKRFEMQRDRDVSGISGTGVVAEGIEFSDGTVVIRWLGDKPSTVVWPSIQAATAVHGHDGSTRFVYEGSGHVRDIPSPEMVQLTNEFIEKLNANAHDLDHVERNP